MKTAGRILVVDDEDNARSALIELLRSEGYVAEGAADGEQALRMLASFAPHVVLTDLTMPVLDGMALLKQGRAVAPHASFIVMTALDCSDTLRRAMQRGAVSVLIKPLDLDAVCTQVERGLESARRTREPWRAAARC